MAAKTIVDKKVKKQSGQSSAKFRGSDLTETVREVPSTSQSYQVHRKDTQGGNGAQDSETCAQACEARGRAVKARDNAVPSERPRKRSRKRKCIEKVPSDDHFQKQSDDEQYDLEVYEIYALGAEVYRSVSLPVEFDGAVPSTSQHYPRNVKVPQQGTSVAKSQATGSHRNAEQPRSDRNHAHIPPSGGHFQNRSGYRPNNFTELNPGNPQPAASSSGPAVPPCKPYKKKRHNSKASGGYYQNDQTSRHNNFHQHLANYQDYTDSSIEYSCDGRRDAYSGYYPCNYFNAVDVPPGQAPPHFNHEGNQGLGSSLEEMKFLLEQERAWRIKAEKDFEDIRDELRLQYDEAKGLTDLINSQLEAEDEAQRELGNLKDEKEELLGTLEEEKLEKEELSAKLESALLSIQQQSVVVQTEQQKCIEAVKKCKELEKQLKLCHRGRQVGRTKEQSKNSITEASVILDNRPEAAEETQKELDNLKKENEELLRRLREGEQEKAKLHAELSSAWSCMQRQSVELQTEQDKCIWAQKKCIRLIEQLRGQQVGGDSQLMNTSVSVCDSETVEQAPACGTETENSHYDCEAVQEGKDYECETDEGESDCDSEFVEGSPDCEYGIDEKDSDCDSEIETEDSDCECEISSEKIDSKSVVEETPDCECETDAEESDCDSDYETEDSDCECEISSEETDSKSDVVEETSDCEYESDAEESDSEPEISTEEVDSGIDTHPASAAEQTEDHVSLWRRLKKFLTPAHRRKHKNQKNLL